jgi:hypothetical protein
MKLALVTVWLAGPPYCGQSFRPSIGVRVTSESQSNVAMWLTVAIDVLHPQNNILGGGNAASRAMRLCH